MVQECKGGKLLERVRFERGDNLVEAVEKLKKGHLLEGSSMTEDEWFKNVIEIQNDKVLDSLIVKMWKLLKRLDMRSYNRKIDAVNQFTGYDIDENVIDFLYEDTQSNTYYDYYTDYVDKYKLLHDVINGTPQQRLRILKDVSSAFIDG